MENKKTIYIIASIAIVALAAFLFYSKKGDETESKESENQENASIEPTEVDADELNQGLRARGLQDANWVRTVHLMQTGGKVRVKGQSTKAFTNRRLFQGMQRIA